MPRLQASFIEFYPPNAQPPCPAPLLLQDGDPLRVQATAVGIALSPADTYAISLLYWQDGAWQYLADDFLPVSVDAGLRICLNNGASPVLPPSHPGGLYRLGLFRLGVLIGLSNEIRLGSQHPHSRLLRYRGTSASTLFDYTDLTYYQQLRLPLRLDRPQYRPDQRLQQGVILPAYSRLHKLYQLETDYLSEHLLEALQLALRHEVFQIQDPATGAWESYLPVGDLQQRWAESALVPLAQGLCQLELVQFAPASTNFVLPGTLLPDASASYLTVVG